MRSHFSFADHFYFRSTGKNSQERYSKHISIAAFVSNSDSGIAPNAFNIQRSMNIICVKQTSIVGLKNDCCRYGCVL